MAEVSEVVEPTKEDKAAAKAAAKAKAKADISNIKLKKENEGRTGTLRSAHLDRAVDIEKASANPVLYLKKYARQYVKNEGKGIYPLLNLFDLTEEQIQELAKQ